MGKWLVWWVSMGPIGINVSVWLALQPVTEAVKAFGGTRALSLLTRCYCWYWPITRRDLCGGMNRTSWVAVSEWKIARTHAEAGRPPSMLQVSLTGLTDNNGASHLYLPNPLYPITKALSWLQRDQSQGPSIPIVWNHCVEKLYKNSWFQYLHHRDNTVPFLASVCPFSVQYTVPNKWVTYTYHSQINSLQSSLEIRSAWNKRHQKPGTGGK